MLQLLHYTNYTFTNDTRYQVAVHIVAAWEIDTLHKA